MNAALLGLISACTVAGDCRAAGVEYRGFHYLRRTFATRLLIVKQALLRVTRLMRHATQTVTGP